MKTLKLTLFLTAVTLSGSLLAKPIITDSVLKNPESARIIGKSVFVSNQGNKKVTLVDMKTGKITERIPTKAKFLNDIFVTNSGVAYTTDTYEGKIYAVNLKTKRVSDSHGEHERGAKWHLFRSW